MQIKSVINCYMKILFLTYILCFRQYNYINLVYKTLILSNFYSAPFELDGIKFSCSEQYYQYSKAKHGGDKTTAAEILATANRVEQMRLGRKLEPLDELWKNSLAETHMKKRR